MAQTDSGGPIQFPCRFPIKAIGKREAVQTQVRAAVARHVPATDLLGLQTRPSRGGRYLAVTVTILARSRPQLDALYQDLNAQSAVDVTL